MRIVIVGGGFLGSSLALGASRRKWNVVVVGRSDPYSLHTVLGATDTCQVLTGDGTVVFPQLLNQEIDAVVVAAGGRFPVPSASAPVEDAMGTLSLLIAVCESIRAASPGVRIVFLSSAGGVYSPGTVPLRESVPARPTSPYGMSRLVGEQYLDYYRRIHGMRTSSLRCSNVYGQLLPQTRGQGVVSAAFWSALTDRPFALGGDGSQVRDFLYLGDFVQVTLDLLACAAELPGLINVGTGCGYSVMQVVERVSAVMNTSISVDAAPGKRTDLGMVVVDPSLLRTLVTFEPRHPEVGIELMAREVMAGRPGSAHHVLSSTCKG